MRSTQHLTRLASTPESVPQEHAPAKSLRRRSGKEIGPMGISTEREGATLIAKTEGRVDGANAREFQDALEEAIDPADRAVILDLENLSYISSAGLRVILLTAKTLRKQDASLSVCSLSEPIRQVFEISGFDKIIPIHASQAEAVAAVSG